MKIFAIKDANDSNGESVAYLIYYEKDKSFSIEIPDGIDEWLVPMPFSAFVKKGIYSIGAEWSKKWVQHRIVPTDRQNLGQILKANHMKEYDEYKMLMLNMGRCEQDDYYLESVKEENLPTFIKQRHKDDVEAVVPMGDHNLLVFFADGSAKKYNAEKMFKRLCKYYERLNPEKLFNEVKAETSGSGISWGSEVVLSKEELFENGKEIPLSLAELRTVIESATVNSAEAAEILGCSRQNIDDLVKRGRLVPLKKSDKAMIFLKTDVMSRC